MSTVVSYFIECWKIDKYRTNTNVSKVVSYFIECW